MKIAEPKQGPERSRGTNLKSKIMRLALVYDRVNKFGGAERVLLALHEIWPEAPLYTSVYNPQTAPWAKVFDIRPSFMQNIPFAKTHHELFPWLTPIAFEQFDFSEFDVVISVSSAEAKNIITTPKTLHICYCLTPTRYLWSGNNLYPKSFLRSLLSVNLRMTDQIASQRPDKYIAISDVVSQRIKKYYRQESEIIYPPVDTDKFKLSKKSGDFFLLVSRLVPYKKVDLAIRTFNKLNKKLIIVGSGSEKKYLKSIASNNIEFLGQNLTDFELLGYYKSCRALVFPSVEDFGIASLEAQACGKPVIVNNQGGASESIINNKTGLCFKTEAQLTNIIKNFDQFKFNPEICRQNAIKYDKAKFKEKFKQVLESNYYDKK